MESKYKPKNLKDCNDIDWCQTCIFGDDDMTIEKCKKRLDFLRYEISTIKTKSDKPKEEKLMTYMWFNIRTVGQLREAITLISDDTKIDIDLRMVENLSNRKKELQYQIPREPRNPETLK